MFTRYEDALRGSVRFRQAGTSKIAHVQDAHLERRSMITSVIGRSSQAYSVTEKATGIVLNVCTITVDYSQSIANVLILRSDIFDALY